MTPVHDQKLFSFMALSLLLIASSLAISSAAPSLSISWYKNNGSGFGDDIGGEWTINTNVSEDIIKVEFYIDDVLQSTDNVAPYSWSFNTINYTLGEHTIKVVGYDALDHTSVAISERNFVEYSFGSTIIIIGVVAILVFIVLIVSSWFWIKRKAKKK